MSSIFEQYCDVTESMAFKSTELHMSSTFSSANQKSMIPSRLKCFNCFGMPDKQQLCSHCGGTSFVTDNHPLALLFNDVFERKLGKTASIKDAILPEYQDVQTIKQQQEQLDERKIICDVCNKQCDINYKYFCQCCECFYVCIKCAEQKGNQIDHPHPLATNKNIPHNLFLLKKTSSNNYDSTKKSQLNNSGKKNLKRNKIDEQQQKFNLQFFNVQNLIEKQNSHTFGNGAQNNSRDPSESINCMDLQMIQSLGPYHFKLIQLQSSDKGLKAINSNTNQDYKLTKSVEPSSNSYFFSDINCKDRQSIDFNIIERDQVCKSIENRQSFGFNYGTYIQEHCSNCGAQLNDVYSICRTCQTDGQDFKICCQCDDKKLFFHQCNHVMEMMLGNLLGRRRSEMASKNLIDSEDEQELPKLSIRKKSSLEKRPPKLQQTPFEQTLSANKLFSKLKELDSDEISKPQKQREYGNGRDSIINLDCEGLYGSTDIGKQLQNIRLVQKKSSLYEVNNSLENIPRISQFIHGKNKAKVGFAEIGSDDDNVHIAFIQSDSDPQEQQIQHYESHQFQEVTIKSSKSSYRGFQSVKSMAFSRNQNIVTTSHSHQVNETIKYSQSSITSNKRLQYRQYQSQVVEESSEVKQEMQYVFYQYHCDECGCDPIKNVRYHCLECQDFDVCEDCYNVAFKCVHDHRFEKIDGLKKLMDKKNMMLQKKDLNKGKESFLRNSSIGMLANSKKTIDLIKRNVHKLGSAVSSIDRSYSSYNDFFNQKFSFKSRIQF